MYTQSKLQGLGGKWGSKQLCFKDFCFRIFHDSSAARRRRSRRLLHLGSSHWYPPGSCLWKML